ncbi:MAG TPA: CHAT domain-containing protein [Thermoanaerobaculia bacterium]
MRQLSVIATILCILVSGCDKEDPKKPDLWRTIEPMTVGAVWQQCNKIPLTPGRVVQQTQCVPRQTGTDLDCGPVIDSFDAAARAITTCTDAAILKLKEGRDTVSRIHLAAALYFRAQQRDRPQDLLPALGAAREAAAMQPQEPAALFNRALIEETIGLHEQAIGSWSQFVKLGIPQWSVEAQEHLTDLQRRARNDAAVQWRLMPARIDEALRARDREALRRRIEMSPSAVASHLTETLLPEWAENPSAKKLEQAQFLAEELSRFTGDPYVKDVVESVARSRDEASVRQGLLHYRAAIHEQEGLATPARSFHDAAEALALTGNPLGLEARARGVFNASAAEAFPALVPVERVALKRGYRRLNAIVHSVRVQQHQADFLKSLKASEAALAVYEQAGDREQLAKGYSRRSEVFRVAGQNELAWREIVQAMRYASDLHLRRDRLFLLGAASKSALALGHADVALLYVDTAITLFQRDFQQIPATELKLIATLRKHISIARRWRADVLIQLGKKELALEELKEADRLVSDDASPSRRLFDATNQAARGDALLQSDPAGAHVAFTRALEQTKPGEMHTRRAWLLAQRGEACRLMKIDPEKDLLAAIQELETEHDSNLASRKRGEGEPFWSTYFSRFPEPHERLIRYYADKGRGEDAFGIAERASAYEPLQLVLQLPDVPKAFHEVVAEDGANVLRSAQRMLPPRTFILQYTILEDRSYVFIVGNGVFEIVPLAVTRNQVERWRADIQRAVARRKEHEFDRAMEPPYGQLVAEPLRRLQRFGRNPHLVFVADEAMHGMPIAAFRDRVSKQYLIQKAAISAAPSTALYLHSRLRDAALPLGDKPTLLLVGNPEFQKNEFTRDLEDLPHALREVEEIDGLYEADAETLTGRDATIPAFLARAEGKTIVHFAAHSIVVEDAPWQSMLVLAPSSDNDTGLLTAEELVKQQWNRTRLLVLSSCSSAAGPVGAEGVGPLVRPILTAGVPAVIGSLWDVEDATAKEFLVSFHRHYEAGSDAAGAMQRAQRELTGNINDVLKWAGFQVIGHASSPTAAHHTRGTQNGLSSSHSVQRSDGVRPQ